MTDYAELEKRLREAIAHFEANLGFELPMESSGPHVDLLTEAADAVADLTRELEEVKEATAPFAAMVAAGDDLARGTQSPIPHQYSGPEWRRLAALHALLSTAQAPAVTGQGEK